MFTKNNILLIVLGFLTIFYNCSPKADEHKTKAKVSESEIEVIDSTELIIEEVEIINETENYISELGYIKITDSLPEILVDLKYSSDDNFLGFNFYGELQNAFVRYECYLKLEKAYKILQNQKPGYTFIIYDALRSVESQQLMWDSVKVEPAKKHWYVANPQKGSIHNFGMALDISIVNEFGEVLDMGTDFDYFGEKAYPSNTEKFYQNGELSEEQYKNRNLLMSVMAEAGFYISKTEWWHYDASSLDYAKSKYEIFSYPININTNDCKEL